eukprot:3429758-Alexandrium_andersonii.AAC.1
MPDELRAVAHEPATGAAQAEQAPTPAVSRSASGAVLPGAAPHTGAVSTPEEARAAAQRPAAAKALPQSTHVARRVARRANLLAHECRRQATEAKRKLEEERRDRRDEVRRMKAQQAEAAEAFHKVGYALGWPGAPSAMLGRPAAGSTGSREGPEPRVGQKPVSYTHLTLPTICSV